MSFGGGVCIFDVPNEYWLKYLCGLYVRLNKCGAGVGFEPEPSNLDGWSYELLRLPKHQLSAE